MHLEYRICSRPNAGRCILYTCTLYTVHERWNRFMYFVYFWMVYLLIINTDKFAFNKFDLRPDGLEAFISIVWTFRNRKTIDWIHVESNIYIFRSIFGLQRLHIWLLFVFNERNEKKKKNCSQCPSPWILSQKCTNHVDFCVNKSLKPHKRCFSREKSFEYANECELSKKIEKTFDLFIVNKI